MISLPRVTVGPNRRNRFRLDIFTARPSFQFFPGDWQRNAKLRICSLAAQGLWLQMICIMHQAEPYGHLRIGPQRVDDNILARAVGISIKDILPLLSELEHAGVFSRESDGTIVCRRMISDEKIRQSRAAGGVKSLDNPRVPQRKDILEDVHADIHVGPPEGRNAVPSPSSSSSSSSSKDDVDVESLTPEVIAGRLRSLGFTRRQIASCVTRDARFIARWIAWLESPTPGIEKPVAFAVHGIQEDLEPPAPALTPPPEITTKQRDRFTDEAERQVLREYKNLTRASSSFRDAVDQCIRKLVAEAAHQGGEHANGAA